MMNSGASSQMFIIKKGVNKTLIPEESAAFDESIEHQVRFMEGANAFVIVGMF